MDVYDPDAIPTELTDQFFAISFSADPGTHELVVNGAIVAFDPP